MSATRFRLSSIGLARRQITRMVKRPPLLLAPILFPLLLFGAFAGGLSVLGAVPNFGYPDYTTFQIVWVLMVGVAMAGMSVGLALAQDFESGFARRILLATAKRTPIVAGYVLAGLALAVIVIVLLFAIGLGVGMDTTHDALDIVGVLGLILLFNVALTLWGIGVALRTRSTQAGPILQTPVLIILFLLPVYVPRNQLAGWVKPVADVNPLTPILESGRGLIVGQPTRVAVAFGIAVALVVVMGVWAVTGLRSAEAREGIRVRARRRRAAAES